jgi:hypothetical protein
MDWRAARIIVAIVTGIFGAIVAKLVEYLLRRSSYVSSTARLSQRSVSPIAVYTSGATAGLLVGYFVLAPMLAVPAPNPAARLAILSPTNDSSVASETIVRGTARDVPSTLHLWLVVVPAGTARYHPQSGPVPISEDGTWSGSV